jgi:hypothetical protein
MNPGWALWAAAAGVGIPMADLARLLGLLLAGLALRKLAQNGDALG